MQRLQLDIFCKLQDVFKRSFFKKTNKQTAHFRQPEEMVLYS